MRRRKLLIGLMSAGVFTAGFGAAVFPATAQLKTITVTLTGGRTVTVQVDQPADAGPQTVTLDAPGASTTARPVPSARQATVPVETIASTGTTSTDPASPTPAQTTSSGPSTTTTSTSTAPAPSTTTTETSAAPATTTAADAASSATPPETRTTTAPADPSSATPATPADPAATPAPDANGLTVDPAPTDPASTTTTPADGTASTTTPPFTAPSGSAGGQQAQTTEGSAVRPDAEGATPTVKVAPVPLQRADGAPTTANPTFTEALPGAAAIGVPNFIIDKFRIPPFLLPIYQAAGIEYGVRWEVLAGINEIETDYGRNLNVSSAGAVGWMQFMPSTWAQYGVDANHDGKKDPYNPVDAIFAAARYLKAAGADTDVRQAVYAYNHADWYVDSVLMRARLIGGMPSDLVGSLTGLTQGRFPVDAKATYADNLEPQDLKHKVAKGQAAALADETKAGRQGIDLYTKVGAPVIATQDARVTHLGTTKRLGRFIQIEDVYGNSYTYAHLGLVAPAYAVPKEQAISKDDVRQELDLPKKDPAPTQAASAGTQAHDPQEIASPSTTTTAADPRIAPDDQTPAATAAAADLAVEKERAFANPSRPAAYASGGEKQLLDGTTDIGSATYRASLVKVLGIDAKDADIKKLRVGSKVVAGTVLGHVGRSKGGIAPYLHFEIRPAGKGTPRIDPKPILDGWKLLESSAVYRAAGKNPFFGPDAKNPSIGQILLMSKESLQRTVLMDKRIAIYDCGRTDIRAGNIDRRVLATLEFLAASGLKPTVSALECGHGLYTTSGNVSEHSTGSAVDIAAINGIPILGHQGSGSITDMTIRRLLTLQGTMKPHQIISLMSFEGTDNTLSMPDHYDHIHVGFRPLYGPDSALGRQLNATLKPSQWIKLITRLGQIDNPKVLTSPSQYATDVKPATTPARASDAHEGD